MCCKSYDERLTSFHHFMFTEALPTEKSIQPYSFCQLTLQYNIVFATTIYATVTWSYSFAELITSPKATFLNYVKSIGFILDVLAVLPLEIFSLIWLSSDEAWAYVVLLRCNRLIKLWKLVAFFSEMEASLYISMAYVNVLKFTTYILTATHLSACTWFLVACFSPGTSSQ